MLFLDYIYIYFHNLAYDLQFLRLFLFEAFAFPKKQLNTKPHYPIYVEFNNGIIIRDSLILSQRSLAKWSKDLNIEHQKAVGAWDYTKIRHQQDNEFTADELLYISNELYSSLFTFCKLIQFFITYIIKCK